jgi:hypothetical protein
MAKMTYELAKKLKDAGFPEKYTKDCKCLPVLSLSNLIEACGERFFELHYHERDGWSAQSNIFTGFDTLEKGGYSSPEEAVANLWLSLQKWPK